MRTRAKDDVTSKADVTSVNEGAGAVGGGKGGAMQGDGQALGLVHAQQHVSRLGHELDSLKHINESLSALNSDLKRQVGYVSVYARSPHAPPVLNQIISKTHFCSYCRLTTDHLLHYYNYHQCETTREKLLESARHATALESSQSELQQELQTIDAFGKQAVARAAKADADYHAYRVNLDAKLEKAHQEHAKELRAKVVEDAELEKIKTDNANLEEQIVAMRSQLEKALEGHDLGDEFKALHAQVTALQLEASDFNVVKTELEHQVEAAELKWERDEERISRQQVEIGRAKQGESGQELAIAAKEAKEAAQRQRIEELESQLKVKIREATDLSAEVDRLDLANTATGSAQLGIDQSTNALRTRVAKLEADAVEHAQQQDHLQDEATKSMAKAKSSELQIKLLEAELTGSVAQVKSMEDHAEADLNAHSAQSDATGREKEAREAAEESTVELRGLLASLRGEKDAVTQHCRELEAKLVDVYGGNDEAKKEALAVHMAELTDVKSERAHLEAEVAHLHDVAGEQEDKLASSASELQNAIAGRGRLALALKKKDREAAAAAAKADRLSERLTLVEDEYHKAIEDHASVQVKQRMAASKAKAKARSEAGEPMSPLSPRFTNAGMSPFGMGRLSSLASRARTISPQHPVTHQRLRKNRVTPRWIATGGCQRLEARSPGEGNRASRDKQRTASN